MYISDYVQENFRTPFTPSKFFSLWPTSSWEKHPFEITPYYIYSESSYFLDIAAAQFSEQVNFTDVGRQALVAYSTVREFYSILEDTLMGFLLYPYLKSIRKRMSQSPKFYFFDNGVTRAILGSLRNPPNFLEKGRLFEQWFIQEVDRINKYFSKDWKLFFWRTSHGAEVDLVIEQAGKMICAIECKCKQTLSRADLSGLHSILEEQPKIPCYIVAPIKTPLKIDTVNVLPPFEMLKRLKE